ncbi:MAG: leucyl/phenylalanyl-tRNA--protein transferase [Actinomycetota bacterium]
MPIEPPASRWDFPVDVRIDEAGLVGVGADEEPGTILAAYRSGLFPMPIETNGPRGWWSPDPRGVLELDALHVSRSLRRSMRHFEFRVDTAFDDVVMGCADPARPHGWIDDRIHRTYRRLHELGWAHSIETWCDDELVGGLYGLGIGGLFAAESKFHRRTDASKAAVVALATGLADGHPRVIDVQWRTEHLATLGVTEISRAAYLDRLRTVLPSPDAPLFADKTRTITHPLA